MSRPAASKDDLRPVCFMVMPFKRKQVSNAAAGAPGEVDFDLLWNRAFYPAIEALGYTPDRADADTGSLIVQDMIVASVPGLRTSQTPFHALTSAVDWSDPDRRGIFRDFAGRLSRFHERTTTVRLMKDEQRPAIVGALANEFGHSFDLPDVSLETVGLLRDDPGEKQFASLDAMDETENLSLWQELGDLASLEQVEEIDFPNKSDLSKI